MMATMKAALLSSLLLCLAPARAPAQAPAPVLTAGERMAMVRMLVPQDTWMSVHIRLPEVRIMGDRVLNETFEARKDSRYRSAYKWLDLSINFLIREDWDRALTSLQSAHETEEFETDYGLLRAWLTEMSGDWPRAMSLYERLIRETPADKVPKHRQVCCAVKLYQPELATRLLKDLMVRDPDQPEHHHLRALVHIIQGDYESAMKDLRRSYELAGRLALPESFAAMALCEMMRGSPGEACGWIVKAHQRGDPRFRVELLSRREWTPLRGTPEWAAMITNHGFTDYPGGDVPASVRLEAMSEGAILYRDKYRIPKSLRVTLQLRMYEPYTTYRTLRDKVNFDAATGRIRPPSEEE